MSDFIRLTDDETKALERFFFLRDRLVRLNLESATLKGVERLVRARMPFLETERPAHRVLRTTMTARWNSARRIHLGLVLASVRTLRRLIRERRGAGLGS